MAECRGRGEAGLAGMDVTAVFRGQPREIKKLDPRSSANEDFSGDLGQSKAFRHFAGARMFRARGAVDQQDLRRPGTVLIVLLRGVDGLMRREPINGEIIVGIGESRSGLAGVRAFS